MTHTTAQPGTIAHLTFPRLGWVMFQQPERVTVIHDRPEEQQATIQLKDGRIAEYPYTGKLEVTRR